mgnify:CR=1 FL=1
MVVPLFSMPLPVAPPSAEAFAAFVKSQAETREKVIKQVGIKIE